MTGQRFRWAKLLVWLFAALVALTLVGGITFGVVAARKSAGTDHSAATAVLGVQIGGPNAVSSASDSVDCLLDGAKNLPNGKILQPCPKNFGISGSITGLYPGKTLNLPVLITNQNNQDIKVTKIQISVTATNKTGCTPTSSNLQPTNFSGPGFVVPKNSSWTILLPITMPHGAVNACQGATFTLQYSGTAVKP